jgi:hypothetical protein
MEENFRLDGSSWYGGIWIVSLGSLLALNAMWRWNCMDMSCLINYLPRSKCMVYNNTVYKSLTIRGLTPDEKCRKWIRRWLGVWCRNVGIKKHSELLRRRGFEPRYSCFRRSIAHHWSWAVGCLNVTETQPREAEFFYVGAPHIKWHDTEMANGWAECSWDWRLPTIPRRRGRSWVRGDLDGEGGSRLHSGETECWGGAVTPYPLPLTFSHSE